MANAEILRRLGRPKTERLAALAQRGYRYSMDHVTDLQIELRKPADRGVRQRPGRAAARSEAALDLPHTPLRLRDWLDRFGIDLVAERIEGERAVVDLLKYDVRRGFLLVPPRPLRPERAPPSAAPEKRGDANAIQSRAENNGPGKPNGGGPSCAGPAPRGNAAPARRAAGRR